VSRDRLSGDEEPPRGHSESTEESKMANRPADDDELFRAGSDALDRGPAEAFGPAPSGTLDVLGPLTEAFGAMPHVLLRDSELSGEPGPVVQPGSPEMPVAADRSTRLQLLGEIARGGMGCVLKGRDPDLGRDLAVKVLLEKHLGNADMVRRFIEEAQIGGQLQHPGIVPVYELGRFTDCRPFFAMKLLKGSTLADLLRERDQGAQALPRLLSIFEAVCQTVGYAHARGVIHRDLKPSNVMVGSFGEVQVMDWGLAKVLPKGGADDDGKAGKIEPRDTIITTARSGGSDPDHSQAGSVMGTPSYMAPEQARGEIEAIDERADVFALGSILCEVLCGHPAFTGRSSGEIHRRASRGDLAEANARLEGCGADRELIDLAHSCLAGDPFDRPRHAGVLAERVTSYLAGVQEKLRRAELARVEERAGHRLRLVVAASVAAILGVLGAGWSWIKYQNAARAAESALALREAIGEAQALRTAAVAAPSGDGTTWVKALEAVRRAQSLVDAGAPAAGARQRLRDLLQSLDEEGRFALTRAAEARADRRILERLGQSRLAFGEYYDRARLGARFADAFREYGIDIQTLDPALAGRRIAARPIALELLGMIDEWIFNQQSSGDERGLARLLAVAAAADLDPWRSRARNALARGDRAALVRLADSIDLDAVPATSAQRLAFGLGLLGDVPRAVALLRRLQRRNPMDYWINVDLANNLLLQTRLRSST
jgi:serine/threonine-protein kinase